MGSLNTPDTHENKKNDSLINEESNNKIADALLLSDVDKIFLAGNTQINSKADLAKIVEKPCLAVCEQLYDKNILTYWSSSNKESPNKAEVIIRWFKCSWYFIHRFIFRFMEYCGRIWTSRNIKDSN